MSSTNAGTAVIRGGVYQVKWVRPLVQALQLMCKGADYLGEYLHLAAWCWSVVGELRRCRYV